MTNFKKAFVSLLFAVGAVSAATVPAAAAAQQGAVSQSHNSQSNDNVAAQSAAAIPNASKDSAPTSFLNRKD
ncbi:hypothetical protein J3B02_000118 [Coemansia erecta]|nr:hypothetical protein J3B02_000118 [Coemansia erecta]